MPITSQEILSKLPPDPTQTVHLRDLLKTLNLSKEDRKELKRVIRVLVREGQAVRHKGGRYSLPPKTPKVIGRLSAHPDGYGFVIPDAEGESDIYISPRSMANAMDGDRVQAQVLAVRANGRREGTITQILERAHSQLVGRFEQAGSSARGSGFVIPQNPKIHHDIYIAPLNTSGAREGDLVVARLVTYPTPQRNPEGRIVRVLGVAGDPGIDTEMIIEEFHLPRIFPEKCVLAAQGLPEKVEASMLRGRRDLRGLNTVTIDGERARDFDDAISIEKVGAGGASKGRYRLWVHIADVAHYVDWETALDREARNRGNSIYFPDQVIPMFPERLSNGICSLNPKEDRLTLTVEMLFDGRGTKLDYEIYESVIRSDERMTYTQVKEILKRESSALLRRYAPLIEDFKIMEELCEVLRRRRMERGSIDFDLPEPEIILDLQGQTMDILKEERNVAHRIIEEFMLAANETVAEHLTARQIPMIYRIHEEPDPDKMLSFNELLQGFGLHLRGIAKVSPKTLQQILEEIKGRPEERLVNTVLLRSMKQARYSSAHAGHFGLAAEYYTHFTSPIRRYPDLVIHRLVKDPGGAGRPERGPDARSRPPSFSVLAETARHCSERERLAVEAERKVIDIKKARFMAERVGQTYSGHISGVLPFGFFVELDEYFVEGLVPISSMTDDQYLFREAQHCVIGLRKRRTYRLGDPVRVRVEKVDLIRHRIDFCLEHLPAMVRDRAGGSSKSRPKDRSRRAKKGRP